MPSLKGKTIFISGASRGIGKAIALRAAADGANLVVAAKTSEPHRVLPGTIYSAAEEIEEAGGNALPLQLDVRDENAIAAAVATASEHFGGLDVLVNNASAINLTGTLQTPMRRFDLMFSVNVRATFALSQACIPWLMKAENPQILTLSPPLNMNPVWFKDHATYTMAKYGMSMCVLGMAEEFRDQGIAVNALWPRTAIDTAAIRLLGDTVKPGNCRTAAIMADAAHSILCSDAGNNSGNFYIDDEVLAREGVTDFDQYAVEPGAPLLKDLFLD